MQYLALLRGINVGGKNIVPMEQLKSCFQKMGYENVLTYIQSGNVLFSSRSRSAKKLSGQIESAIANQFTIQSQVFCISATEYFHELECAHSRFGKDKNCKHNAMFIVDASKPTDILAKIGSPVKGIETVSHGSRTLFWTANKNQIGKTAMMKISKSPVYRKLTVRNHNTAFKLAELLGQQ